MHYTVKLLITVGVILLAAHIGKRFPSLAGLVATMPITGLLVLLWLSSDNPGDSTLLVGYTRGALFGIVPSVMFYLTALVCFSRGMGLAASVGASFAVWIVGAIAHQALLR